MEIKPKDKFRHFKGSIVEVVCLAKNSENLEDMVVYTHNNEYWVRPLSMFLDKEDVSFNGRCEKCYNEECMEGTK